MNKNKDTRTSLEVLSTISSKDYSWIDRFRERQKNQYWLKYSAKIAFKILTKLKQNRENNLNPENELELAGILDISEEKMKNIIMGDENLDIKTILDIQKALYIKLIEFV